MLIFSSVNEIHYVYSVTAELFSEGFMILIQVLLPSFFSFSIQECKVKYDFLVLDIQLLNRFPIHLWTATFLSLVFDNIPDVAHSTH